MSIQNAKTHLQKWHKKTTEDHQLAKSVFFWKIERFDLMKPLKKLSIVQKQTLLMIFLKCVSTVNAPCHFPREKFMLSDRGKTLRKNKKKWKKIIILMKDFVGLNRTLPKTCLKIVTKTLKNPKSFQFLMHCSWNAKAHGFSEAICNGCSHFGKIVRFRGWFSAMIYRYKYDVFSIDVWISTFLYRFFQPPQLTMQKQRFKNETKNQQKTMNWLVSTYETWLKMLHGKPCSANNFFNNKR